MRRGFSSARGVVALVVSLGLGLGACAGTPGEDPDPVPAEVIAEIDGEPLSYQLDEIATLTAEELDVKIGVAVFEEEGIHQAGTLLSGAAWSTVKVPLALAAMREDPGLEPQMRSAIEESDNDTARELWHSLGPPPEARAAVEEVLRESGDEVTVVDGDHLMENRRGFGDTEWTLAAQAKFAAHLRCLSDVEPLLDAMTHIDEEQSYGLGRVPGTAFKGGWGPDEETGEYLVRQFGLIPVGSGEAGVAIAVEPADGTYETGQLALTRLAEALAPVLSDARPVQCQPDTGQ